MTGIHALLDAVSTGQPVSAISVDDLVRIGRRRQRRFAAGVAAGAAGIVVIAAVATGQLQNHAQPPGGNATPSATGSARVAVPVPQPSQYSGSRVVVGPHGPASSINTASLLIDGRTIETEVDGPLCAATEPLLVVVRQTASEVRLRLMLTGGIKESRDSSCGSRTPAAPIDGAEESGGSQREQARLADPLGHRRLVDDSTGAVIPYLRAADALVAAHLPAGFVAAAVLVPSVDGWDSTYTRSTHGTPESLLVGQFPSVVELDPPKPTDTVSGAPAVFRNDGPYELNLRWQRDGKTVDLRYTSCAVPPGQSASCAPAVLTKAELLQIADSVH